MLFYSQKARESALKEIERLTIKVAKVATIKGSELSFLDAHGINKFLGLLRDQIAKEIKMEKSK